MAGRTAADDLQRWLADVESGGTAAPIGEGAVCLLYLLDLEPDGAHLPSLNVVSARRRADGGYGSVQAQPKAAHSHARQVGEFDRRLLQFIEARQGAHVGPPWRLEGEWGVAVLRELLGSGRCHWQSEQAPPLSLGDSRPGQFRWQLDTRGRSRLQLDVEPAATALPLQPPWYVDPGHTMAGPIDSGVPAALAGSLLCAAPAAPDEVATLAARWPEALGEYAERVPPPPPVRFRRRRDVQPVPVLALRQSWLSQSWAREEAIDAATLSFDYAGLRCAPDTPPGPLTRVQGNQVTQIERQLRREQELLARLHRARLTTVHDYYHKPTPLLAPPPSIGRVGWVDFLAGEAPKLRADGWRLEIDPDFPWRLHEPDEEWSLRIDSSGGWFDVGLQISIDGREMPLLPLLVSLLRQNGDKLTPAKLRALPDDAPLIVRDDAGRLIRLPAARVRPILSTLIELYDEQPLEADGRLRLPRWAGVLLDDLGSGAKLQRDGGGPLHDWGARVRAAGATMAPPAGLQADLRDYQREGLAWLQMLREYGFGGVLADDMGLGKTLQTLAHILTEKVAGRLDRPVLIVAPTSLVFNWRREAARFTPDLQVLVLHGSDRRRRFAAIEHADVVLTTYALLPRDLEHLRRQRWHLLVLDEAQNIKNARSKAAQSVGKLDARHRLCLSGTPLENHLGELWSLFHFLMPGYLGDDAQFRRRFRTPIEKNDDAEIRTQLARRIAPFLLRRTKNEVASELPPRTEIIRSVPLEGGQRDLYETVRAAMQEEVQAEIERRGIAQSRIALLAALLRLRQICCDPRLLKTDEAQAVRESAKLDLLMTLLPELLRGGRRVLLFSQFTSMLELIEEALRERGIDYLLLTGATQDRESLVDRFQDGEVPLFLISLKAGGVGLNLTAADTVIHYDPWWNPAVENQATDRAHRIGQDKPVFVYKLLSEGTVEEKIAELQSRKRALAEALFAESAESLQLDDESLSDLFAPLG
ncbi:DEAD/DEAH box helicase [Solimonas marina]|uniref:DEAD/DEAH box helicase n=1 Tax=Solimonas marina TaxID=2714601 RepID=A0A969W7W2_9GAMM|nr:DEAD/DEAH box helicase [Solimonas marina]NKF22247.1 DEAD/DEAH box helicase [Solimonas marina]